MVFSQPLTGKYMKAAKLSRKPAGSIWRRHDSSLWSGVARCGLVVWLPVAMALPLRAEDPSPAPASTNAPPAAAAEGPSSYKKMSLQELMDLDVTSVSKQAEPY